MIIDINVDELELSIIPETQFEVALMNHFSWREMSVSYEKTVVGSSVVKVKAEKCLKKVLE